jgi:predicted amidohydrolase
MRGIPISYDNFTVYPEYCELNLTQLREISLCNPRYLVASILENHHNTAYLLRLGNVLYTRDKYRPHPSEKVGRGSQGPSTVILPDRTKVLLLICYEILFPEDYLPLQEYPDLIIHLVGIPMFDEEQREGWVAMQKALSIILNCPLVCCCGGPVGRMNITGVVKEGVLRSRNELD